MHKFGCLVFSLALLLFCTSRQLAKGKICVLKDAIPKKHELQRLGIITGIAGSYNGYSEVGTLLLKDDYGDMIGVLSKDYIYVTALVEEIFHHWTAGRGATPVSWAGLVTCLRLAKLNRLANDIESAYCAAEDSHTVTDEGVLDEQGPPMAQYRSRRPVDEVYASTGLQTWIIYAFTAACTLGTIIAATCYIHCHYFTPLPVQDAVCTSRNPTRLAQRTSYFITCTTRSMKSILHFIFLLTVLWIVRRTWNTEGYPYIDKVPSIIDEEQFKHVFNLTTTIHEINLAVLNNTNITESDVITDASKRLDSIVSRQKARKLRASVIGIVKTGKSTTLNALLGNRYLPGTLQPQTAKEVSIVHKTGTVGELYGVKDGKYDLLASGHQSIHDKLLEIGRTVRQGVDRYERIFLHAPLRFLMTDKLQGIQFELSDTPGLGEAASEHFSLETELAIRDVCAFIVIMRLDILRTNPEAELLMKLSKYHPKLFTDLNRILILVNGYDLSNRDKSKYNLQASDIPAYVSDYLRRINVLGNGKNISKELIIPFSALWGLRARLWLADPDTLLKHSDARNLYDEAIITLDRAGYGHEVESLKGERNRENVLKLSHLLEDFSHITLVESNLTNMVYMHGATVLIKSFVDDTLSVANDIKTEISHMIAKEKLLHMLRKVSLTENVRSLLASYTSTVDKYINIINEFDHFVEVATRITLSNVMDYLEFSLNCIVNNVLYEILEATTEHEEKKHIQSKIISTKSAILSLAATKMKKEWIKVTDSIHRVILGHIKVILSELSVELVSSFTSQSGFMDKQTIKHSRKVASMTYKRLTGLRDTAVGFISSSNASGLELKLNYKGKGNERVTIAALNKRLIQSKKTKYVLKSDTVCIGRPQFLIVEPKECVRIHVITVPYDVTVYSPDFGSIQSDFGEVVKGWIKAFAAEVDEYRSKMSETVANELKSEIESVLTLPIQQLEDDLHLKEDALKQSKANFEFLNFMKKKLNRANRDLEEFIDRNL